MQLFDQFCVAEHCTFLTPLHGYPVETQTVTARFTFPECLILFSTMLIKMIVIKDVYNMHCIHKSLSPK